jgi:hypothetical protein
MDRRRTLKWIAAASAASPLWRTLGRAASGTAASEHAPPDAASELEPRAPGYGTDPALTRIYRPGDVWPLTLTVAERRTASALCDVIIPADEHSPSASAVGVVDFLDEWVSAPYPRQQQDRSVVRAGLEWLDAEAVRRFQRPFCDLGEAQQGAVCNDICCEDTARPEFTQAAVFFATFRDLTAGGFYSAPAGRLDLGFVGNVPMAAFEGPAPDLLRALGLTEVRPGALPVASGPALPVASGPALPVASGPAP